MSSPSPILAVGLVILVAAFTLFARRLWARRARQEALRSWRDACDDAGLRPDLQVPAPDAFARVAGVINGRHVEAWVEELRLDGTTTQYVRLRVAMAPGCPELFARVPRGEAEGVTWPAVHTDDPLFDARIRVNAANPGDARTWLTGRRRRALRQLSDAGLRWSIGNGYVGLSATGVPRVPVLRRDWIDPMILATDALAEP